MSLAITISYGNGRELRLGAAVIGLLALLPLVALLWLLLKPAPLIVVAAPNDGQQSELQALRQALDVQFSELAARVGQVQAQAQRLEALGQEMAERYTRGDVDFSVAEMPAVGGPATDIAPQVNGEELLALLEQLEQVSMQLSHGSEHLSALDSVLRGEELQALNGVAGLPVGNGYISSYFGRRSDPFSGRASRHLGIDFAGKAGSEIVATGAGIVVDARYHRDYGYMIEIDHGHGLRTRYGHNKALLVKAGELVSRGQVIAHMGSTGRSTGNHLHYEVLRDGKQVNPLKYVYPQQG